MPRIGEVLIASGVIDDRQLAEALRAQVMWGGRVGTALVELGHVRLDELAVALGRLHHLPAALAAHFERADPMLQLPRDIAEAHACVPLVRAGKRIVIASIDPLRVPELERVAGALGLAGDMLIASIVPELRLRYFLEHAYGIARPPRFLRVRGATSRQFADMRVLDEPAPVASDGVPIEPAIELPSAALSGEPTHPGTVEHRHYIETLADVAATLDRNAIGKQAGAGPKLAAGTSETPLAHADPAALSGALTAIEAGLDRDDVARLAIDAIAAYEDDVTAALLLTIRGTAAASWTGFSRDGGKPPSLAVPLDHQGLVPAVIRRRQTRRSASGDLGTIDFLLLVSFGAEEGDLVIVPIEVAGQVVAVIALAAKTGAAVERSEAIARAAGAGFVRLMRETKRKVTRDGENVVARVDLQPARSSPE